MSLFFRVVHEVDFLMPLAEQAAVDPVFQLGEGGLLASFFDFAREVALELFEFGDSSGVADAGEETVGDEASDQEAENHPGETKSHGTNLSALPASS